MKISIVSPAHNEEKNIKPLVKEVSKVLSELGKYDFEIILVDDGSTDSTWEEIQKASKDNPEVRGVKFTRNFGQAIALTAGLHKATGDCVIYLDSDLQHPPKLIPELVNKWEDGAKVVHTYRTETKEEPLIKKFFSKSFYKVINWLSDTEFKKGMSDFKLIDKVVLEQINSMTGYKKFLRGLLPWLGYKEEIVEFKAKERMYGTPSYNLTKNLDFAQDGIISFSTKPLKMIAGLGFLLMLFSVCILIFSVARSLYIGAWFLSPIFSLLLFNTLLIGLVITCLGVMGLYLSFIHQEVIDRPLYLVSETVNIENS